MLISFFIFLGIILSAVYEAKTSFKKNDFGIFQYFICWFAIIYAIIPLSILISPDNVSGYYTELDKINRSGFEYFPESLIILVSYLSILLGGCQLKNTKWKIEQVHTNNSTLYRYSILFYIASITFFSFFIIKYGGIDYVLKNLSQIRSGTDDNKSYVGAFAIMLSDLIIISFILSLYLKFKGFFNRKFIMNIIFYIIIFSVFIKFFIGAGRANIILLFVYILLSSYFIKNKISFRLLLASTAIGLFIIFFGKIFLFNIFSESNPIFYDVINNQDKYGFFNKLMHEFNHQFFTLSNYIQNNTDSRFLKDYVIWILKPLKLLDKSETFYDSISYYNTYHLTGRWDSEVPPGFIGLAFMNGNIIMLIIQSFLWGRFTKWIDCLFNNSDFINNGILFVIYILIFNWGWFAFQNGDPALIIQYGFIYIILFIFLLITKKVRLIKYYKNSI